MNVDHVTDWVFTVEDQREPVVCKSIGLHWKGRMNAESCGERATQLTFVVATSGGQKTHQACEFLCINLDDLGELVDVDALGVIQENISDVLSEGNADASVVVHLHELEATDVSIGLRLVRTGVLMAHVDSSV